MHFEFGTFEHLSQVISHVVAPSFLLGSVASFISILISRLNVVLERLRKIESSNDTTHVNTKSLKDTSNSLKLRLSYLHKAIMLAIGSGIVATLLIVFAFATALFNLNHVWVSALFFMISLSALCASLILFGLEVQEGLNEFSTPI